MPVLYWLLHRKYFKFWIACWGYFTSCISWWSYIEYFSAGSSPYRVLYLSLLAALVSWFDTIIDIFRRNLSTHNHRLFLLSIFLNTDVVWNKAVVIWMGLHLMDWWVWDLEKFQFLVSLQKQDWSATLSQCVLMRKILVGFILGMKDQPLSNLLHSCLQMGNSMDHFMLLFSSLLYINVHLIELILRFKDFMIFSFLFWSNWCVYSVWPILLGWRPVVSENLVLNKQALVQWLIVEHHLHFFLMKFMIE